MYLELIIAQADRYGSLLILLHVDIQFSKHYLLKMLPFSSVCVVDIFVKLSEGCSYVCS
jgi:hypothetical protein